MNRGIIKSCLLFSGISLLIFLVFYPVLNSYFVNDDLRLIYISSPLSVNSISDFFTSSGGWFAGLYRPIIRIIFYMEHSLYKLNPAGYHLTNVLFHTSVTIMVFYFTRILTDSGKAGSFAALIFAIHPLHTEAVTWISGRGDLIFTFFYLLALLGFIKYISLERKKVIYLIVSACCFLLSLLSKESAITLPVILFITEAFYSKKSSNNGRYRMKFANYMPFLFVMVLYVSIKFFFIGGSLYIDKIGLITFLRTGYHFFQLFAPVNIDTFNSKNLVQFALNLIIVLNFAVPFIIYLYFSKDKMKHLYLFIYCALWILITSFPLYLGSGVRYLYISSIASSAVTGLIVADGLNAVENHSLKLSKIITPLLIISILLTFSIRTVQRNYIYNDAGDVAKRILSQIGNMHAQFPAGSVLYFINFPHEGIRDTETWITPIPVIKVAIQVKYGDKTLIVYHERKRFSTFEDKLRFLEQRSLREYVRDGKQYYVFEYRDGNVVETTDIFKIRK